MSYHNKEVDAVDKKLVQKNMSTNFLISIHHQENHSWQGSIQWLDTGKKLHFRSELELLNLMNQAVQMNQIKEESNRNWEEDKKINAG